jgi:hypothetical protein
LNGIVELGYDVAWNIGDAALLTRTVTGYAELAGDSSRLMLEVQSPVTSSTAAPELVGIEFSPTIKTSFPPLPGYERFEEYTRFMLTASHSKFLTLKDVEIPSPSPYPAGVLKIDLTESLDANLPFYEWNWGISGSVTVPHTSRGVSSGSDTVNNKRLAWAAIGLILKERRDRAVGLSTTQQPKTTTLEKQKDKMLPTSLNASSSATKCLG